MHEIEIVIIESDLSHIVQYLYLSSWHLPAVTSLYSRSSKWALTCYEEWEIGMVVVEITI